MRGASSAVAVLGVVALAVVACRSTQGDSVATKADTMAPPSALGAADAASGDGAQVDAAPRQTVRFSLLVSDTGRKRRFLPGVAITRTEMDGGAAPVAIDPPTDGGADGQQIIASPLAPGHYRAHFMVAGCAPDSPAGGCRVTNPKPDDTEFDVPASGDVEVTVR